VLRTETTHRCQPGHSFTTFAVVSRRLSQLLRQVSCQTHFLSPEHTSEPGVGNVENRSGNRDAELLGGLRACAIRHRLGKRERSLRCGSAADGSPSIRSFDERKAGRQLSRRNRPGVGLHSTARKEVGEVRSSDGGFRRGGTGDHQGGRWVDGNAQGLRCHASVVLHLHRESGRLECRWSAGNDGRLDTVEARHCQSVRKLPRDHTP
jgi:hypothetical protein